MWGSKTQNIYSDFKYEDKNFEQFHTKIQFQEKGSKDFSRK